MIKIRNIEKASKRIKEAVKKNEQIMICGDSDMDGVASVVILQETINNLGNKNNIVIAFSDRDDGGYGLNFKIVDYFNQEKKGPALIITLDCGITSNAEVKKAKELGFDVMIVDHHKVLDSEPEADLIVDPKHPKDKSLFKEYANAGLTFKLSKEILKEDMSEYLEENFIELVMLATIADMMKEEDENEEWILKGLKTINKSQRPAIQSFYAVLNEMDFSSKRTFIQKIISVFNTVKMENHKIKTYLFMINNNLEECKEVLKELMEDTEERQREIRAAVGNLKMDLKGSSSNIVFEGSPQYRTDYLGAVSSRILSYFKKPTFIYCMKEKISRGAVRVPKGMDAVEAMGTCKDILITYGGHPPAAGFSIENDKLPEFEERLKKYFNSL